MIYAKYKYVGITIMSPRRGGKICRNAVAKYLVLASSMGGRGQWLFRRPGEPGQVAAYIEDLPRQPDRWGMNRVEPWIVRAGEFFRSQIPPRKREEPLFPVP